MQGMVHLHRVLPQEIHVPLNGDRRIRVVGKTQDQVPFTGIIDLPLEVVMDLFPTVPVHQVVYDRTGYRHVGAF